MAEMEGSPHRCAPGVDRFVPTEPLMGGHNIECCDGSPFEGERECRPRMSLSRELHMHSLDISSGNLFLYGQIQANERKGQRDWLGLSIRVLRCECIDD